MQESMTSDEFVTGILAALALMEETDLNVVDRRFDESMAVAYHSLLNQKSLDHLNISFQVSPDAIHGDSNVIQESLMTAVQCRVVARVNPTFREVKIILHKERAERLLSNLPGNRDLYTGLANTFWTNYSGQSDATIS